MNLHVAAPISVNLKLKRYIVGDSVPIKLMKKLNPEHIKANLDLINQAPYFKLLSMKVQI